MTDKNSMENVGSNIAVPPPAAPPVRRPRRLRRWIILGVCLAVAAVAVGIWLWGPSDAPAQTIPTAKVVRGDLPISITESGEVKAQVQKTICNEQNWPVVIRQLSPEGRIVQKGDVIIEMECQELVDAITDQEIAVTNGQDAYLSASKTSVVTRKQQEAKVKKAEQAVLDAGNDLKKYEEGEAPQKLNDADANIALAESDLKLAEHRLQSKVKINEDPELNQPYSQNEIDAEKLTVDRLKLALVKAQTDKELLTTYTHPRSLRDKQVGVDDAKLNLECTKLDAETQIRLAEAAEQSSKIKLNKQQERLKKLKDDAAKLHVVAEEPGLVVHDTRRFRWDRPVNVAVGERIQPSQQLMIIPDMNTLAVETRVYEAIREQVRTDMPANIRLDAKRGQTIRGSISKIAPLPDSQNPWLSPGVKVYNTFVKFEQDVPGLKPGMTAEVEIIVNVIKDALMVPIAAIFMENETAYCYKAGPAGPEKVQVAIGGTNETHAQITSGLKEGETVLLSPPPGAVSGGKFKSLGKKEASSQPASRPVEAMVTSAPTSQPDANDPASQPATASAPASRPCQSRPAEPTTSSGPASRPESRP